jgi:hypothetical protein
MSANKTAPAWITGLVEVLGALVNSPAMQPADKASLQSTLNDVASSAVGVAEEAPALAEAGVAEVGTLAATAANGTNPLLGEAVQVGEAVTLPAIEAVVGNALANFENTLISHNKNTIAAIGSLMGSTQSSVSTAQAQITPVS